MPHTATESFYNGYWIAVSRPDDSPTSRLESGALLPVWSNCEFSVLLRRNPTLGWIARSSRAPGLRMTGVGGLLPLQKCAKLFQEYPPGGLIGEKKVISARQRYESRIWNFRRQYSTFLWRHGSITVAVKHDCWAADPRKQPAHVDLVARLHNAPCIFWGR